MTNYFSEDYGITNQKEEKMDIKYKKQKKMLELMQI